jgi:hypothetical protein
MFFAYVSLAALFAATIYSAVLTTRIWRFYRKQRRSDDETFISIQQS